MGVQEKIPELISKGAMYGGGFTTVTSGAVNHVALKEPEELMHLLSFTEFLAVAGFIVALAGFVVNWIYKHKHLQLEERKFNEKYIKNSNADVFKSRASTINANQ